MANSMLYTVRIVLWTLVVVAAAGAGVLWYSTQVRPDPSGQLAAAPQGQYGAGDYRLVDHTGAPVDQTAFTGKPSMVFFGFTHCPDVCPTTLGDMQHWYAELGDDADGVNAFFVSVDPERDTPAVLGEYVGWVSERITGITGEPAEIGKMVDAWGVFAEKEPLEGGGYNVNHTASVFLIDGAGQLFGTIAYGEGAETAVGKLRRLVSEG
ncbi:SCO family protein [Pelagibacterium halotolerans]|uniref:Cytochrome oxidase biogenesis protein Sco1/SenC/PrrC, putative copper metallochaperone n=1 Tax=Pelagibacterium halotolerans (strain DSM 22347 / JCM 15775 / CGMCC 1.7692 / B2) TaxID=1082931 RepID=G4RD91_PELHB|nr:SCO family protein [Pelagibacterium halotolerans]AEQ50717.1 cytochrome oxidase biogenesis protein Sco1/SenC/PrrC, putative copper metallochaperone [Pelagibacterium halotolerans B2]QJR19357.1 SCO family protein [Pelagibacterium halotolerans]SDZ93872.1 protein SCO1/2 [Pelagibacterium halotolerans]